MFVLNMPLPPPYNAKTGQSLGPRIAGNYGRPLISKDDESTEEDGTELSITQRLGRDNDPLDKVIVTTTIPKPKKPSSSLKAILKKLEKKFKP